MIDKITQLMNDLKSADYCCHRIIELNQELEVMNHKILGLSHSTPALTKEQLRSPYPLPTYNHSYMSPLAKMEVISELEREREYYKKRLFECKSIELLDLTDQNILFDLYFFRKNSWDVAEKYGYTRKGLWKHIRGELKKLMQQEVLNTR